MKPDVSGELRILTSSSPHDFRSLYATQADIPYLTTRGSFILLC
jgi:hypothetical protein